MKYLITLFLIVLMSCNSGTNAENNNNLPDPEIVNPVEDAIPQDMKIKNDSVVVPDTAQLRKDSLVP